MRDDFSSIQQMVEAIYQWHSRDFPMFTQVTQQPTQPPALPEVPIISPPSDLDLQPAPSYVSYESDSGNREVQVEDTTSSTMHTPQKCPIPQPMDIKVFDNERHPSYERSRSPPRLHARIPSESERRSRASPDDMYVTSV